MQYDPIQDPFRDDLSSSGLDLLLSTCLPNLNCLSPPTTKISKGVQNLENWVVRSHSRSLKIAPFDRGRRVLISLPE